MPDFPQDGSYLDRDADSLSRATDAMSVCYDLGPDSDVVRHAETLTAPGDLEQSSSGRRIIVDALQPWRSNAATWLVLLALLVTAWMLHRSFRAVPLHPTHLDYPWIITSVPMLAASTLLTLHIS